MSSLDIQHASFSATPLDRIRAENKNLPWTYAVTTPLAKIQWLQLWRYSLCLAQRNRSLPEPCRYDLGRQEISSY